MTEEKKTDITGSFSSASSTYPIKIILNDKVLSMIREKKLAPVSIALNLTNRCNLRCSFCSCDGRDRNLSLSFSQIENLIETNRTIQSAILTGGGEPLLCSFFSELINYLYEKKISIALVTNGLLLKRYSPSLLDQIKWTRVSLSSASDHNGCFETIQDMINKTKKMKWSFSYVIGDDEEKDFHCIGKFYKAFYEQINHMRIVNDLFVLSNRVERLKTTFSCCADIDIDKMIFQERTDHTHGSKRCYISLLKPNITAEGFIAPCCGTQYAVYGKKEDRKYNSNLILGTMENSQQAFNVPYFDGSNCDVCYYKSYNDIIDKLINPNIEDIEFI